MTGRGRNLFHAAFGVAAGIAGLAAGRCGGGSCSRCLACAVPGASVVALAVLGKLTSRARSAAARASAEERERRALAGTEGLARR